MRDPSAAAIAVIAVITVVAVIAAKGQANIDAARRRREIQFLPQEWDAHRAMRTI